MDRVMMDYLERKLRGNDYGYGSQGGGDQGRGTYNISGGYDNRDMNYPPRGDMNYPVRGDMYPPHGDMRTMRGDMNYPMMNPMDCGGYPMDQRQGVKGTGPYGIGGSMHYGRGDRADGAEYGYGDNRGDYGKFKMPKLTKAEKHKWEQMMRNTDGTHGPHYDMSQVMQMADKMGLRFHEYDEKDFALVMNMLYSDFGQVVKKYLPVEKETMFLADMAKAYFDDPDGPEPEDKLSRQYHCMMDHA